MRTQLLYGAMIGLAAAVLHFTIAYMQPARVAGSYHEVAQSIVAVCSESTHAPTCYDEEIPKLMDQGYSMEDAFEVTREVQQLDRSYQYCHILGHYLSAQETAKDPERWKDVIARAPTGVCSNGSIHGAFQERFRTDSFESRPVEIIAPELKGICTPRADWQPTPIGVATCVHALGHLTMYVTAANIEDSLLLCDMLVPEDDLSAQRQLCYDGVFMQIFQPLDPEDFALIVGQEVETQAEARALCAQFEGAHLSSCVSESWPLYVEEMDNPDTVAVLCDPLIGQGWNHERCFKGVFYVAMARSNLSVDWAVDFCPRTDASLQGLCFANAASRLIETDSRNVQKSLSLCAAADAAGEGQMCYDELVTYSAYIFDVASPEFTELCAGLPQPWAAQCSGTLGQER